MTQILNYKEQKSHKKRLSIIEHLLKSHLNDMTKLQHDFILIEILKRKRSERSQEQKQYIYTRLQEFPSMIKLKAQVPI